MPPPMFRCFCGRESTPWTTGTWSIIPPGAAVYGYFGTKYSHVGIYVGNGLVYHNIGGVAVDTLSDWIQKYRGFCWGWEAGSDLTQYD